MYSQRALCRRKWNPTPVFLPGESHGQRSLVGYTVHGIAKRDMNDTNLSTKNFEVPLSQGFRKKINLTLVENYKFACNTWDLCCTKVIFMCMMSTCSSRFVEIQMWISNIPTTMLFRVGMLNHRFREKEKHWDRHIQKLASFKEETTCIKESNSLVTFSKILLWNKMLYYFNVVNHLIKISSKARWIFHTPLYPHYETQTWHMS